MAKKSKKSDDSSGEDNAAAGPKTRIELVTEPDETAVQNGRVGLGLVLSFPLGWGPLNDAFSGRGAFEFAIGKYLLIVLACVAGTTFIGSLLDKAPAPKTPPDTTEDADSDQGDEPAKASR